MKNLLILSSLIFLVGCHQSDKKVPMASMNEEIAQVDTFTWNGLVAWQDWVIINDSLLVVQNRGTDTIFSVFDTDSFQVVSKTGLVGQGPDEYLYPKLIKGTESLCIFDNGTRRITKPGSNSAAKSVVLSLPNAKTAWDPYFYDSEHLMYIQNSPNELDLVSCDWQTNKSHTLLSLTDETKKGLSNNFMFAYSYSPDSALLCLGFNHENKIQIYKMPSWDCCDLALELEGTAEPDKTYYTNVIAADRLYLLNQSSVQAEELTGETCLDIYTYNGAPVKHIRLGGIFNAMLYDKLHHRLLLHSPLEDDIFFGIDIPNHH